MNTTNWLILSGVMVMAGKWARGKTMDVPSVAALFFVAAMISVLSQIDAELANAMTILIVVAIAYTNVPDIITAFKNAQNVGKGVGKAAGEGTVQGGRLI